MRRQVWRLHSWLGLLGALPLLVIGLTGSLLIFDEEIEEWRNPGRFDVAPSATRASLDEVLAKVHAAHPDFVPFAWDDSPHAGRTASFRGSRGEDGFSVHYDPHTGALRYAGTGGNPLGDWLIGLHVSFFAGTWGLVIVGVFAVVLMTAGLSGVYLYREFWRHLFTLRWRRGTRLLLSDSHKFIGITSVAFNLILGLSGALWNLPAIRDLYPREAASEEEKPAPFAIPKLPLETALATARASISGYRPTGLYFPDAETGFVTRGEVPTWNPFRSRWGSEVTIDADTGAVTKVNDQRRAGWWTQFEDMLTPLHFGTFGGLPIKILWCLGGLTPGALGVLGFLIWRARHRRGNTTPRQLVAAR